jgi:hypothetical protein
MNFELANPNPEFLIKSIAEQGYSLETALADLIDNSITANANRIEILTDTESTPFELFLADNGDGMNFVSLKKNMQFPSQSPEDTRKSEDLGRFGLGLKTASFSQTRKFTVLSRKKGEEKFYAVTWDVDHLKDSNKWEILINSENEIKVFLDRFKEISNNHLENSNDFTPNTIIVWQGLYKFENYLDESNKKAAFKEEITNNTSEYLSIVFHRFMEKEDNQLKIRLNNTIVKPFNPFRTENSGLRVLEARHKEFGKDIIKIQGFILPNISIKESKNNNSIWAPNNKSLIDMEGIYVYRANRLILFGGWNNLIKKSARMQLGRLKVEIGNKIDHLFHLNVAKSQINIPHDLKISFLREISNLTKESQKEYFNHILTNIPNKQKKDSSDLFHKVATNKGVLMNYNEDFPLLKSLKNSLNSQQKAELNFILKLTSNTINKVRQVDNIEIIGDEEKDGISTDEIVKSINELLKYGMTKEQIKKDILPNLGFKNNFPEAIFLLLK